MVNNDERKFTHNGFEYIESEKLDGTKDTYETNALGMKGNKIASGDVLGISYAVENNETVYSDPFFGRSSRDKAIDQYRSGDWSSREKNHSNRGTNRNPRDPIIYSSNYTVTWWDKMWFVILWFIASSIWIALANFIAFDSGIFSVAVGVMVFLVFLGIIGAVIWECSRGILREM